MQWAGLRWARPGGPAFGEGQVNSKNLGLNARPCLPCLSRASAGHPPTLQTLGPSWRRQFPFFATARCPGLISIGQHLGTKTPDGEGGVPGHHPCCHLKKTRQGGIARQGKGMARESSKNASSSLSLMAPLTWQQILFSLFEIWIASWAVCSNCQMNSRSQNGCQ